MLKSTQPQGSQSPPPALLGHDPREVEWSGPPFPSCFAPGPPHCLLPLPEISQLDSLHPVCLLSSIGLCFWGPPTEGNCTHNVTISTCAQEPGPQPDTNTESPDHQLSDPVPSGDKGHRKHRLSKAVAGSSPLLLWGGWPEEGERAAQTVMWRPAAMGAEGGRDRTHLLERAPQTQNTRVAQGAGGSDTIQG